MPNHTTYAAPTSLSEVYAVADAATSGTETEGHPGHLDDEPEGVADHRQERVAPPDGEGAADGEQQARAGDLDEQDRGDHEGERAGWCWACPDCPLAGGRRHSLSRRLRSALEASL